MRRISVFALLAILMIVVIGAAPTLRTTAQEGYADVPQGTTPEGLPVLGDPAAPITLVEFTNFSCPGCASYQATVHEMITTHVFTGQARIIIVPLIFGFGTEPSFIAAQGALCAVEQNGFWEMHDALFAIHRDRGPRAFTPETIRATAGELGLDGDAVAACVESGEKAAVVNAGLAWAQEADVRFTPTLMYSLDGGETLLWFAQSNGARFDSSVPADVVAAVVAQAGAGEVPAVGQLPPTPTPADVFANVTYIPWRSPDNLIELEHPEGWDAVPNRNGGPVAYYIIAPNNQGDTGLSLLVLPYRVLFDTDDVADPSAEALLADLFPEIGPDGIRTVQAGDLTGAAVLLNEQGIIRDLWFLPIGGESVLLIQSIAPVASQEQMEAVFARALETVRIDAAAAIARLDEFFPRVAASLPFPADSEAFVQRSIGEGPCVGVADPTDVAVPEGGSGQTWSAPEVVIDPAHVYCAILTTENGRIVIELYPQIAPTHVNNFVFLAQQGYFDGITWHRVIPDFVAQSGDPSGMGSGGPGYAVALEVDPRALYDREGVLGMARTNAPDSAGSQFFITFGPEPNLDPSDFSPGYTIFGQVVEGMDVVRLITPRDPSTGVTTPGDILLSVRIVDLGPRQ